MYFDFEKAEKNFIAYTHKFDLTNPHILRKQGHSLRVMKLCERIAQSESFKQEEIEIAKMIGLLHDIARFRQYTEYKTFNDEKSLIMEIWQSKY